VLGGYPLHIKKNNKNQSNLIKSKKSD